MTDAQRVSFLRRMCAALGRNYDGTLLVDLWADFEELREKAEKYDDLCR